MSKRHSEIAGTLHVDGETATIRLATRREVWVCRVLGRVERGGTEMLYLDRLLHEPHHTHCCGYEASGAITTILSRPIARETEQPGAPDSGPRPDAYGGPTQAATFGVQQ